MEQPKQTRYVQVVINNWTEDDLTQCRNPPTWVKMFKYQKEICPTTSTPHVNGYACFKYPVTLTALKKWLPRAHFKFPSSEEHRKNMEMYAHKDDTHVPGSRELIVGDSERLTLDKACYKLAQEVWDKQDLFKRHINKAHLLIEDRNVHDPAKEFKYAVCAILRKDATRAGFYANPSLRNFWLLTREVWVEQVTIDEIEYLSLVGEPCDWCSRSHPPPVNKDCDYTPGCLVVRDDDDIEPENIFVSE
nr:MAG: replication associated protein [Cressdnaviricota sp.]